MFSQYIRLEKPDIILIQMSLASEIRAELELADAARSAGNEGRARVCARRAAGMAARDFLNRHQIAHDYAIQGGIPTNSAYEALKTLATFPGLAPPLRQSIVHLTMRVTTEFQLPRGIDLIDEAHKLIGGLK
jgi:hypothetical protein